MTKYVDAVKVAEAIEKYHGIPFVDMVDTMATVPAEDVEKVRHGHWVSVEGDVEYKCSKCDSVVSTSWDYDDCDMFNYCPCCGAKMDEREDEK